MTAVVRIPTSDDVGSDHELARYIRAHMQISNRLGYEYAVMSAALTAMLKDADKRAGQNRRRKVARPLRMAAGTMVLVSRQLALVERRFRELYGVELGAQKRRTTRRNMSFS